MSNKIYLGPWQDVPKEYNYRYQNNDYYKVRTDIRNNIIICMAISCIDELYYCWDECFTKAEDAMNYWDNKVKSEKIRYILLDSQEQVEKIKYLL